MNCTDITPERDAWCAARFADHSDYELSSWAFALDAHIIEHNAYCCCDEEGCPEDIVQGRKMLAALTYEEERRTREGIEIRKDSDPRIEEELAPFGPEWEREQRARMEGRD
jgi:hypothetical protein